MEFEIAHYWVFFLLPLPILVLWFIPAFKKRQAALLFPNFNEYLQQSKQTAHRSAWISKRNFVQWLTLITVWCLIIFATSSPQFVGQPEIKTKTSRSFLIAADLSFSMDINDWESNGQMISRWEGVRELMHDFINYREGDQLGLVFFGTNAYMQAPLTPDLDIIRWNLDETEVGMAGQTTGIGNAIGYSIKLFANDTLAHKTMLLLSDGVDSGSDISPLDAAILAKKDSIKIYTLGIGDPTKKGADLDERTLKEIAQITGGAYFLAKDKKQLALAYEQLNALEPIEFEEENYKPTQLLYPYPLGIALGLSLVFFFTTSIIQLFKKKETGL